MTIEDIAENFAYEEMMKYTEKVGDFFMQDEYEENAASEIFKEAFEKKLKELNKM
ncbi:MAG: hypothetical protein IJY25_03080 [Bacilli bacterium]|nr:hypothetical protein [Bacilli bacterium]